MSVVCELSSPFVANSAVEGTEVARLLRRHTSSCLRCQARHASMSRTARALEAMSDSHSEAPADIEWRVMSSLEDDMALVRSWRRPVALAAAVVSMAAAVLVWRLKPRAG